MSSPLTARGITQTAIDAITSALRTINVTASGEVPSNEEANDALAVFNQMLDAWNAEELCIFTTRIDDFNLVAGTQAYTLGTGGTFNMARPARIDGMSVLRQNSPSVVELPIAVYTTMEWQEKLPVKTVSGTFPLLCYDDGAFPLRNLQFWPVPTDADKVRLYTWQPLSVLASLTTAFVYPPGYAEAIHYNLAARLALEFRTPLDPVLLAAAQQSLARIKTMNVVIDSLKSDLQRPGQAGWNYKADLFGLPW